MGPDTDVSKWSLVKDENGGSRDIAANTDGGERPSLWGAGD